MSRFLQFDSIAELEAFDQRLLTVVVGLARWRLALGDALERLGKAGGPVTLGF